MGEINLKNIIENINCGIVVVDKNLNIKLWNRAVESYCKIRKENALNKNIREIFGAKIGKSIENSIKSGGIKKIEIGKKIYSVKAGPLELSKGEIGAWICVMDITERIKEKKRLEDILRIKEIFIDIMSHDLLNVVTVMEGMIRLAKEEDREEELKEILDKLEKNTKRLEKMIENASKYAKLERVEELNFQKKNLSEIIHMVVDNFIYLARKKNIKILFEGEDSIAEVHESIVDLISNFVSNALKYSPENSKVTIGLKSKNDKILIYIKDYGPGIPDKYKKSIFERFTRVKKEGVKGSGLGLAIVKRIAKIHKGRVWVEDNPEGRGSIFYVELPKNH